MTYQIRANKKDYTVDDHAAQRMLQRAITDEMLIAALEHGAISPQPHGRDLYEHQYFDEDADMMVIVQAVVDEAKRLIITVIDVSDSAL